MNEGSDEVQNDRAMEGDGVAELEQGSVKDQSSDDPPEGSIMMAFTICQKYGGFACGFLGIYPQYLTTSLSDTSKNRAYYSLSACPTKLPVS